MNNGNMSYRDRVRKGHACDECGKDFSSTHQVCIPLFVYSLSNPHLHGHSLSLSPSIGNRKSCDHKRNNNSWLSMPAFIQGKSRTSVLTVTKPSNRSVRLDVHDHQLNANYSFRFFFDTALPRSAAYTIAYRFVLAYTQRYTV